MPLIEKSYREEVIFITSKIEVSIINSRILFIKLRGFQQVNEAIKDHAVISRTAHDRNLNLLLIDQRSLKVLSEDMKVFFVQAIQETTQNGILKIATLQPNNIFARNSISSVEAQSDLLKSYQHQHFSDESAAISWLLE